MERISIGIPIPLKDEVQSPAKDLGSSFKSLKRSLKDTLERLEAVGINEIAPIDEVTMLRIQLSQKEKIIQNQALEIERLKSLLQSKISEE